MAGTSIFTTVFSLSHLTPLNITTALPNTQNAVPLHPLQPQINPAPESRPPQNERTIDPGDLAGRESYPDGQYASLEPSTGPRIRAQQQTPPPLSEIAQNITPTPTPKLSNIIPLGNFPSSLMLVNQHFNAARKALEREDHDTVCNAYQSAISLLESHEGADPDSRSMLYTRMPKGRKLMIEATFGAARSLIHRREFQEAASLYRKATEILLAQKSKQSVPRYTKMPHGRNLLLEALSGAASLESLIPQPAEDHVSTDSDAPPSQKSGIVGNARKRISSWIAGEPTFEDLSNEESEPLSPHLLTDQIRQLELFKRDHPENEEGPLHLATADLFIAMLMMEHAYAYREPLDSLLKAAHDKLEGVVETTTEIGGAKPGDAIWERAQNLKLGAYLLCLEIISKRLLHASNRRDWEEGNQLQGHIYRTTEHMVNTLKEVRRHRENTKDLSEKINAIAEQIVDIAILLMRMQLFNPGIRVANDILNNVLFRNSPARKRLLADEAFASVVRHGNRIPEYEELRDIARQSGRWTSVEKMKAALVHQDSTSLAKTAQVATAGAFMGGALYFLGSGQVSVTAAMAGVLAATMAHRLERGLLSEESRSAGAIGYSGLSWKESAIGAGELLARSMLVMLASSIPIAIASKGGDGVSAFIDPIFCAVGLYGKAFLPSTWTNIYDKFAAGNSEIFPSFVRAPFFWHPNPEQPWFASTLDFLGISSVAHAFSNPSLHKVIDYAFWPLLTLYKGASILLYMYNLAQPKAHQRVKKLAPWFLPGAILASADIGMLVAGKEDHWSRVLRGMIVSAELMIAMAISGLIKMERGATSVGEKAKNFWKAASKKANWLYPIAGVVGTNTNSALGGLMQHGKNNDVIIALLQGMGITFGLLPFAIVASGLPKGLISFWERFREGWQDGTSWKKFPMALWGGITALTGASYTDNRSRRIVPIDPWPATPRALIGWDTNWGQAAFSFFNVFFSGPAATAVYPELSGSRWERQEGIISKQITMDEMRTSIMSPDAQERDHGLQESEEAVRDFQTFLRRAGQRVHILHPLLSFRNILDNLAPALSLMRGYRKPQHPHVSNAKTLANVHQILMEGYPHERMSDEALEHMLQFVEQGAIEINSRDRDVAKVWAIMLALARESERFGSHIRNFFEQKPYVALLLDLDLQKLRLPEGLTRRQMRAYVRRTVHKPFATFEQECRSHGRQYRQFGHMRELFQGGRRIIDLKTKKHDRSTSERNRMLKRKGLASGTFKRPDENIHSKK